MFTLQQVQLKYNTELTLKNCTSFTSSVSMNIHFILTSTSLGQNSQRDSSLSSTHANIHITDEFINSKQQHVGSTNKLAGNLTFTSSS
jgi:hypothetical protein